MARRPRVVALELDPARYRALTNRERAARGVSPLNLLAAFQSRIARQYGVHVGDEMLAAARAARDVGADVAFIDLDARAVLVGLWRTMDFRERMRLVLSAVSSVFVRPGRVEAELRRFQEDEASYLEDFAKELPTAKRVLIDERDEHMSRALRELHADRGDIVAVVGDGHVEGLARRLAGLPVQAVRLRELRAPPSQGTSSATVSFQLDG